MPRRVVPPSLTEDEVRAADVLGMNLSRFAIMKVFLHSPPLPSREIQSRTGLPKHAVWQHLQDLEDQGVVTTNIRDRVVRRIAREAPLWRVTPAANEMLTVVYDTLFSRLTDER